MFLSIRNYKCLDSEELTLMLRISENTFISREEEMYPQPEQSIVHKKKSESKEL
jgi:hypothetical protein